MSLRVQAVLHPVALTATDCAVAIANGRLTASSLARICLDRAAARDAQLRAWACLDPTQVLADAAALDRIRPAARGPLHGLPIGIKDVILTRDQPTQYNSELYRGFHPRLDAACVMTLRAAGALIFGKTETVEFASTGRVAPTRNPHDVERTPGGSSSGSAAAVADGHVPLALGTQTGGSIIRPASYCGVFAIKPTWNLVSREGARMFAASLDTVGWFARSAADLKLLYDVFDPDATYTPAVSLKGARIALCRSPAWPRAETATRTALATAVELLEHAGAEVSELALPPAFDELIEVQRLIMRAEARSAFLGEYRAYPGQLAPSLREQVENVDGISRTALCRAYDRAAACRAQFDELAAGFDAVLTPSTIGDAPPGLALTGDYCFNAIWTLLHVPCINVPGLVSRQGLPVGLSLTGPRYSDARLLAVAEALGTMLATHTAASDGAGG